jgi:tetratricopeptide (TPR) repeat protein
MMPPLLGDEQINCGPDWTDTRAPDGRVFSLKTPTGDYDLASIAAKLSSAQSPDLVVCLVDAAWRNLPRNLGAFSCPRILLIADTHHLNNPISGMLRYLRAEPFTRSVLLYGRHHAGFFQSAGVRDLFWFPGLTFPHTDKAVRAARMTGARSRKIAFVGQAAKHHPRRARLLEKLIAQKLPLAQQSVPQAAALGVYGSSLLGFNASLNGDLNLRVFEVIASGAALITDRLAPESGLANLLTDGRELITYGTPEELAERATQAVARSVETKAIGAAGARWFDNHLGEEHRRAAFCRLAFDGAALPAFTLPDSTKTRVFFSGDFDRLTQAIEAYEAIQEMHREQETVTVELDETAPADIAAMCATLPRVQTLTASPESKTDFAAFSRQTSELPRTRYLWSHDAVARDLPALTANLSAHGFTPTKPGGALFLKTHEPAKSKGAEAQAAFERGAFGEAIEFAQAALAQNSGSLDALFVITQLAARAGKSDLARESLESARQLAPQDPRIASLEKHFSLR